MIALMSNASVVKMKRMNYVLSEDKRGLRMTNYRLQMKTGHPVSGIQYPVSSPQSSVPLHTRNHFLRIACSKHIITGYQYVSSSVDELGGIGIIHTAIDFDEE